MYIAYACTYNTDLLRELLFLLSNMAQAPALQASLRAAGAAAAVTAVMRTHVESAEIQAMGCSALSNIVALPPAAAGGGGGGGECGDGDGAEEARGRPALYIAMSILYVHVYKSICISIDLCI